MNRLGLLTVLGVALAAWLLPSAALASVGKVYSTEDFDATW